MLKLKNLSTFLLILSIVIFFTSQSFAQGPGKNRPGKGQRMDYIKLLKMTEALELSEDEAIKLNFKLKKHRDNMDDIQKKMQEITSQMNNHTGKSTKDKVDTKKINSLVEQYISQVEKFSKERERYINDVLSMLNPSQKARFIVFQESFPREFRKKMNNFRKKGRNSSNNFQRGRRAPAANPTEQTDLQPPPN